MPTLLLALLLGFSSAPTPGTFLEYDVVTRGQRSTQRFIWGEGTLDFVQTRDGRLDFAVRSFPERPEEVHLLMGASVLLYRGERAEALRHLLPPIPKGRARSETLTVRAGRFATQRVESRGTIVWFSDRVPFHRIVQARTASGDRYELVAMGSQGRSPFPERYTPIPIPQNLDLGALPDAP